MTAPVGPTGATIEGMMSTMRGLAGLTMEQIASTFRGPTGSYAPPIPLTPEQIIANAKAAEAADRVLLAPFKTPNITDINTSITKWIDTGSKPIYVILSITLAPPQKCSDGIKRTLYDYISWLLEMNVGRQTRYISANFPGKDISYSVSGNTLKLHVSKE